MSNPNESAALGASSVAELQVGPRMGAIFAAALLGGIIAGSVDIGAAALINSANPTQILKAIAAGLLGKAAFRGGANIMTLGLLLQWLMSILIAGIFGVASLWLPIIRRHWVQSGLAYGVVVFLVMNYVVLPLSAVGHAPPFRPLHLFEDMLAMLIFGLIVAFTARSR
jgi:uncharacterized membrane protein YagU involved in acid resistance